ncbi:LysR substrate-binding domain-containing protein [Burkholderia sp. Cy-637]|uniref:LysR substrate-binding domain-containing protein n=1 Tax=Burkholderia sp. Cy-637 TaxID=2608327 RepID=UPI00142361A1|nr:LysR substrate-binding domain-containing protein [Burkholderia sp. Cy-637]
MALMLAGKRKIRYLGGAFKYPCRFVDNEITAETASFNPCRPDQKQPCRYRIRIVNPSTTTGDSTDMRLPSLRNLQVFETAARHQSFREAADALFLTHGAVGKQIKALETELGVELFARIGRRVVLTSHGRRLLIAMSEALERISETVGELQQESRHPADRLPVTVVPSFATRWLLPRLADFHERHPEVTVELVPTVATLDLSAKHIPLGIRMGQGSWSGLEAERLTTEELFPVAAPDGIEGFASLPGSVRDMLRYPLLNPYDEWERWFKRAGIKTPVSARGPTYQDASQLLRAAEERKGVALGRRWLAMDAIREGRLVRLQGPAMPTAHAYFLVRPKAHPFPAAAQAFVAWIRHQILQCQIDFPESGSSSSS